MFGDISDAATGKPIEGAVVVVKSAALQGEQVGATDASGRYTITLLPPGTYSVHVEATGYKAFDQGGIVLPVGRSIRVNIALAPVAVVAKEVVVTAKQTATVDQGSTTVGALLEKEFLERIPLGRTYESALVVTPTATVQDSRVGVNFAGAQGVENTYLVDGMNVTNTGFGTLGTTLPPEFLEQLEVKVGGYMPEFGRATGGIVNTVLKSGGNEWHGDIFYNYSGQWLRAIPEQTRFNIFGRRDMLNLAHDIGFAVGGPIVKDKLWVFAGFDPRWSLFDVQRFVYRRFESAPGTYATCTVGSPGCPESGFIEALSTRQQFDQNTRILNFALKLTYAPTPDQRLALSFFGDPSQTSGVQGGVASSIARAPSGFLGTSDFGAYNVILNYYGKFFDKRVQVEATAGYQRELSKTVIDPRGDLFERTTGAPWQIPEAACAQDPAMRLPTCPAATDYRIHSGLFSDSLFVRGSAALKVSFLLPRNLVKVGADMEWNVYDSIFYYGGVGTIPGGGGGLRTRLGFRSYRDLNGDGVRDRELVKNLILERGFVRRGADDQAIVQPSPVNQKSFSRNIGVFLQDSISILDNLTFNAGFRWEHQQVFGVNGPCTVGDEVGTPILLPDGKEAPCGADTPLDRQLATVLTLAKNIAPRAGLIWDPFKDGRTKIYGSFGVYYESVPLDMGNRALGPLDVFYLTRRDLQNNLITEAGFFGGHSTGIVTDISPQYSFEWLAGIEHEVLPSYRIGLTWIKRNLGNVIEDLSVDNGNTYFLGNPGRGPRAADVRASVMAGGPLPPHCRFSITDPTDPDHFASMLCTGDFPEPQRNYEAWTVYFEKRRTEDQPWQFRLAYTLSWLRGNYPGLFHSDIGQLDPNLSQQFDIVELLPNRFGYLPNDHRHLIKAFGSYEFPKKWLGNHSITIGIGLNAESGAPYTALGFHELYGQNEAYLLPRGFIFDKDGNPVEGRTPWLISADLFFEYGYQITKDVRLSFNAVIFNFLNLQEALRVDQTFTFDPVCPSQPINGRLARLSETRVAEGFDPLTHECIPGTDPPTRNPNFGTPLIKQAPISARLGLKLTF
jgi:hypothetical protein